MLWSRRVDEQTTPQPVVILLGPTGSGKTFALNSISQDCGGAIVHAQFDFSHTEQSSTVEVLTRASFDFSRKWPRRGTPDFTRFTLGLVAVQADLDGLSRQQAIDKLRELINRLIRNYRADRLAELVGNLVQAAVKGNLLPAPLGAIVTLALPVLINGLSRKSIDAAQKWHSDIPQAQGATPLDALVTLNQQARLQPAVMVGWLTSAFLADIRDSQPRLAKPDPRSDCACPNKSTGRHYHNWLLLLDNLDHPGGVEFVEDLLAARERHLHLHPGQHDALLVIGTSGRWHDVLTTGWRPPWQARPLAPDGLHTVPCAPDASYRHWSQLEPRTPHYPVRLEPLTIDETARLLASDELATGTKLAQRMTSGLPAALRVVAPLVTGPSPASGARDLLLRPVDADLADGRTAELELWRSRLAASRVTGNLAGLSIDDVILAAPFATAPWLVPGTVTLPMPNVGRILTELRAALWVTAPTHGGGTADYAELHPWISRALVSALAARGDSAYENQFKTLLADPDTHADPARTAYCQLALGRVSEVIALFEETFNEGPHRDWVDRLRLVTRAPDNRPPQRNTYSLYQQLIQQDNRKKPGEHRPVGNIVRRLIIARWLSANPFAAPDPDLRTVIAAAYSELPHWSRQPDVAALEHAARRDLHELF
jgi:hypothetical protein